MHHPSGYVIPDAEPILIFRAKDLGVLAAITAYLDMLIEQEPSSTIKDHIMSMLDVTRNILDYQTQENVKSVTCSITAHRSTAKQLKTDVYAAIDHAEKHLADVYGVQGK